MKPTPAPPSRKTRKTRDYLKPRTIIREHAWYYVNRSGSVDLIVREPNVATIAVRLTRPQLVKMLADVAAHSAKKGK
jgi:hypothetical protein